MKVRHKATGIELDVVSQSLRGEYVMYNTRGGSLIYEKDPEWEVVPDVVWEDVTDACYATSTGLLNKSVAIICHNNGHLCESMGFRIRKIDGLHHGPAFIVEKRKS